MLEEIQEFKDTSKTNIKRYTTHANEHKNNETANKRFYFAKEREMIKKKLKKLNKNISNFTPKGK